MAVYLGHFTVPQALDFAAKLASKFLTDGKLFSFSETPYLASQQRPNVVVDKRKYRTSTSLMF